MASRTGSAIVQVFVLGMLATASAGQQGYTVTEISASALGGTNVRPESVNNSGQVVGTFRSSSGLDHAFLWHAGVFQDIDGDPARTSAAHAINNSGVVVGDATAPDGLTTAFRWTPPGPLEFLTVFAGENRNGFESTARDINNFGKIVGWGVRSGLPPFSGIGFRAYRMEANAVTGTDIGTICGQGGGGDRTQCGQDSRAFGLDNGGSIVGEADPPIGGFINGPCYWTSTGTSGIPMEVGTGRGRDINNFQKIVGVHYGFGQERARLWRFVNGQLQRTILPQLPDFTGSDAFSVMNEVDPFIPAQIVGTCKSGTLSRAVRWLVPLQGTPTVHDLNEFLPQGSTLSSLTAATSINDNGQIVGTGIKDGVAVGFFFGPPVNLPPTIDIAFLVDASALPPSDRFCNRQSPSGRCRDYHEQLLALSAFFRGDTPLGMLPADGTIGVTVLQYGTSETEDTIGTLLPYQVINGPGQWLLLAGTLLSINVHRPVAFPVNNVPSGVRVAAERLAQDGREGTRMICVFPATPHLGAAGSLADATTDAQDMGVQHVSFHGFGRGLTAAEFENQYAPYALGSKPYFFKTLGELTFHLPSLCLGEPFVFDSLEVTQTIQDQECTVPVYENKPTCVRVYHRSANSLDPSAIQLRISTNDGHTGIANAQNEELVPPLSLDPSQDRRADTRAGFLFEIPIEQAHGSVVLDVLDKPQSSSVSRTVTFESTPLRKLRLVRISHKPPRAKESLEVTESVMAQLAEDLHLILPASGLDVQTWGTVYKLAAPAPTHDEKGRPYSALLLAAMQDLHRNNPDTLFHGVVNAPGDMRGGDPRHGVLGPVVGGVGLSGASVAVLSVDSTIHEIGHSLGLNHPRDPDFATPVGFCISATNDDEENFPHVGIINGRRVPLLGPRDPATPRDWIYGFVVLPRAEDSLGIWPTVIASLPGLKRFRALSPSVFSDNMSYCDPTWLSVTTYGKMASQLNRQSSQGVAAGQPQARRSFRARFLPNGALATEPLRWLPEGTLAQGGSMDFEVEIEDTKGLTLFSVPVDVERLWSDPGGQPLLQLSAEVPFEEKAARLVVKKSGEEIGRLTASESTPTISLASISFGDTLSVRWEAHDPDGDTLTYDIFYSIDGGESWDLLQRDWSATSFAADSSRLPGSSRSVLRVDVTDGFHAQSVVSELFQTPDKEPFARIRSLEDGDTFRGAQTVPLEASALDLEDGQDLTIQWFSDRDGPLAEGKLTSVHAADLSLGAHEVIARATDSGGNVFSDTVAIVIDSLAYETPEVAGAFEVTSRRILDGTHQLVYLNGRILPAALGIRGSGDPFKEIHGEVHVQLGSQTTSANLIDHAGVWGLRMPDEFIRSFWLSRDGRFKLLLNLLSQEMGGPIVFSLTVNEVFGVAEVDAGRAKGRTR